MADREVAVKLKLDASGAITGVTLLDSRFRKAGKGVTDLQRRTTRARDVMVRSFRQMGRAAALFTKSFGAIRRTLFTLRFLVLGFFVQQFVNRILRPLIDATVDLDRAQFRLGSAVNAAQKRFGQAAGKVREYFDLIVELRSETNQFSIRELTEVVAGVAELGRNFGVTGAQVKLLSRRILDLAAATGRTLTDVITRIRSGFLGSTEAIEDLGINFKVTRLQQEAFLLKMRGQFQLLTDVEQAQVRFSKAMKDSTEITGTLSKVTETISGRMRALGAAWSDLILLISQALVNTRGFQTVFEGVANLIQVATGNLKKLSKAGEQLRDVMNTLLGIFGSLFNFFVKGPALFAALFRELNSIGEIVTSIISGVVLAQGTKGLLSGAPLTLRETLAAAIASVFSLAIGKSELTISGFFIELFTIFRDGFKDFQLTTVKFAENAGGIFGDTFDIRDIDLQPIAEGLKNAGSAMKALIAQFGGVRQEGILTRFIPPKDMLQFQRDTDRVASVLSDLRTRVEEDLVKVRSAIINLGTDVRKTDPAEIANQFSKMAQGLGELIGQENEIIAFQQAMADFSLIMSLANGTFDLSTLTIDQLTAAINRLGIALEDVDIKGEGLFVRLAKELPKLIDITAQINQAVTSSLQSLGALFANLATGVEAPLKKFAAAILGVLGDLAIQLGSLFIAMGIGWIALRNGFANPAALIAAGAALVVVGGLIKGIASSLASGTALGAAGGATTGVDSGPLEFTVPLSSISPRQGIADDGLGEALDRLNSNLSRIEAQPGVLIVKEGVRQAGGITGLLTSTDRQQLTQRVLRQPTLNTF